MPPPGPCEANAGLFEIATVASAASTARDVEALMHEDVMTLSIRKTTEEDTAIVCAGFTRACESYVTMIALLRGI